MSDSRQEKRARWFTHVNQWKSSGLTQSVYCKEQNISHVKFHYYIKLFKKNQQPTKLQKKQHSSFVQIAQPPVKPIMCSLTFLNGTTLNFSDEIDSQQLKRLATVVQSC